MEFYFDYLSHNAWLGWTRLRRLAAAKDLEIQAVPVLFAGLLKAWNQLGPAEVPPKNLWMIRNVLRKSSAEGLALNPPAYHPFNPLLALRATTATTDRESRNNLVDAMFRAVWSESQDITQPTIVENICNQCGLDGAKVLRDAADDTVKQALRESTDRAIERGVFGVPTVVVNDELFWGYDDMNWLERYLNNDDPLTQEQVAGWLDIKPSSVRKRK